MVERHLAKVDVVSSNLIARSIIYHTTAPPSGFFVPLGPENMRCQKPLIELIWPDFAEESWQSPPS